jgi:hypothetical protein
MGGADGREGFALTQVIGSHPLKVDGTVLTMLIS